MTAFFIDRFISEKKHNWEILFIAAVPIWNQIYGYSVPIVVVWQGWINGSRITILKIPYFSFDLTKFVLNIFIYFSIDNLRAIICPTTNLNGCITTNHNCCSTICYWSMTHSGCFEISIKWPFIIFIFCNDWRPWGFISEPPIKNAAWFVDVTQ